jgi:hypothetical protein
MVRHNERGIPDEPRQILIPSSWIDGETLQQKNDSPTMEGLSAQISAS